jgi:hypothetical protein
MWAGGVVLLAIAALIAAAVIPGSHSSSSADSDVAQLRIAHATTQTQRGKPLVTKVVDSHISAKNYGALIAAMENGVNREGQMVPDLTPVRAVRFRPVFAHYRRYAERWDDTLAAQVNTLTATLRSGDRARARTEWGTAFADYLHLGATYGLLPDAISHQIDGLPPYTGTRDFPGLHRIEMGLWTAEPVRSLVPVAEQLRGAVTRLHHVLATTPLDPLDYVARGHEVLEDAQRDYLSGTQVPWSHEGVLATAAGVAATKELIHTMAPLLGGRGDIIGTSTYWLARIDQVLRTLRRPDGAYLTNAQLTSRQRLDLNSAVAGALSQLQTLPSTLETVTPPQFGTDPDNSTYK